MQIVWLYNQGFQNLLLVFCRYETQHNIYKKELINIKNTKVV